VTEFSAKLNLPYDPKLPRNVKYDPENEGKYKSGTLAPYATAGQSVVKRMAWRGDRKFGGQFQSCLDPSIRDARP